MKNKDAFGFYDEKIKKQFIKDKMKMLYKKDAQKDMTSKNKLNIVYKEKKVFSKKEKIRRNELIKSIKHIKDIYTDAIEASNIITKEEKLTRKKELNLLKTYLSEFIN